MSIGQKVKAVVEREGKKFYAKGKIIAINDTTIICELKARVLRKFHFNKETLMSGEWKLYEK